ncbi:MAG TPA: DUF4239 domain-containing protein [Candidatus Angelobacter sp.]|nr:DUF4239 domain-containing protein [Candidatus Angelobacter sp.]
MITVGQNIAVVAATVLVSLFAMAMLNKVWPRESRRGYNELIGWQLAVLGTTYAVILGFMLYAVWSTFGEADLNVDAEATAVVDVYRLASGLPDPQRTQLQRLARDYVDAVISQDWPQMARGQVPEQSMAINQEMWKAVMSLKEASPTQVNAQEHAMSELESLARRRLIRIRQSKSSLPGMLWCVLLVGGALTIISSCTLGSENIKLQSLEVFCFSLLVSLTLVAISDIHRPFRGQIHVSDYSFQQARQIMQFLSKTN